MQVRAFALKKHILAVSAFVVNKSSSKADITAHRRVASMAEIRRPIVEIVYTYMCSA